ncbi:MAG TPA: ATP-binding protein [Burkholderiales bacterium]|nr:ATP-binding protein [Burkholderiales bacterium]
MPDCVLRFPATFDAYPRAAEQLREALDRRTLDERPRYRVELVFEEVVTNVIRHSSSRHLSCSIEVDIRFEKDQVVLSFEDDGRPFDPRQYELPPLPQSLEEAGVGGLGIMLVRGASTHIDYERTRENRNHLTVRIAA